MTHEAGAACPRRFVEMGGLRVRVFVHDGREGDSGPAVILIHGAGGNYLQWPPSLRRMAGMRVIAPDLPGHGDSTGSGYDRISEYAHVIGDLAKTMGLERAVVIGHSMGAAIALEYARLAGEAVGGIGVLAGGVELAVSADLAGGLRTDFHATTERIAAAAFGPNTPARRRTLYMERLRQADPDVLYRDFVACREYDARPYAASVDAPCMIVTGSRDRLIPSAASVALHELMPHSLLYVLPGAGHMFLWEQTDQVVRMAVELAERVKPK